MIGDKYVKYVGEWKNDFQHGHGEMYNANGSKYVGQYQNGKSHGQGVYSQPNGVQLDGYWLNDKYYGPEGPAPPKNSRSKYDSLDDLANASVSLTGSLFSYAEIIHFLHQTIDTEMRQLNELGKEGSQRYKDIMKCLSVLQLIMRNDALGHQQMVYVHAKLACVGAVQFFQAFISQSFVKDYETFEDFLEEINQVATDSRGVRSDFKAAVQLQDAVLKATRASENELKAISKELKESLQFYHTCGNDYDNDSKMFLKLSEQERKTREAKGDAEATPKEVKFLDASRLLKAEYPKYFVVSEKLQNLLWKASELPLASEDYY